MYQHLHRARPYQKQEEYDRATCLIRFIPGGSIARKGRALGAAKAESLCVLRGGVANPGGGLVHQLVQLAVAIYQTAHAPLETFNQKKGSPRDVYYTCCCLRNKKMFRSLLSTFHHPHVSNCTRIFRLLMYSAWPATVTQGTQRNKPFVKLKGTSLGSHRWNNRVSS